MKKILQITARSDEGGGPKHVAQILQLLNKKFEFYSASPKDSPYFETFKKSSNRHFYIPHRKIDLIRGLELICWCRDNCINIVHSHGRGAIFYAFILALFGFRVVHTFHGIHTKKGLKNEVTALIERFLYLFFDHLIFVSESEKNQAEKLKLNTLGYSSIIPNGVNVSGIKTKYDSISVLDARKLFDLPKDIFILGTLSRLDPHKQNDLLVKSLLHLPVYVHLAIAGDGEQEKELKNIIKMHSLSDRVHMLGRISNPIEFLKSIDIYISTSKSEGHPYSVLEALACNKKILLSSVPGHIGLIDKKYYFKNISELKSLIETVNDSRPLDDISLESMGNKISRLYFAL